MNRYRTFAAMPAAEGNGGADSYGRHGNVDADPNAAGKDQQRLQRRRLHRIVTSPPVVAILSSLATAAVCMTYMRWLGSPSTGKRVCSLAGVNSSRPVLFVGGCPRSGTTLMRVMLDSHPDVFCGEETRVIPEMLSLVRKWRKDREQQRQLAGGVTQDIVDDNARDFIWRVLRRHGDKTPTQRLMCAKDPMTMRHAVYVSQLLPNSKFIFMIRDGRAVAASIVKRKIRITRVNGSSHVDTLRFWQTMMSSMMDQCSQLGPSRCLKVRYEDLVQSPLTTTHTIMDFLQLPWSSNLLRHQELVAAGNVLISKLEPSSDQVAEALHTRALQRWRDGFPAEVLRNAAQLAPMLKELGYADDLLQPGGGVGGGNL